MANSDTRQRTTVEDRRTGRLTSIGESVGTVAPPSRTGRRWSGSVPVKVSILMPALNEARTIRHAVQAVLDVQLPCESELIVIDDGSGDETGEILATMVGPRMRVVTHPRNLGKGAALMSGAATATGTHLLPFDADLEYCPDDIPRLLEPVLKDRCDIVYGTRLFGQNTVFQSYRYAMGNRAMTSIANIMFDAYLSDMHTCLKLIPLALFRQLNLKETGFGLDTELTAALLRSGARPFEVPVSYHSRTHAEGKKINWRDGLVCLRILGRVRFTGKPSHRPHVVPSQHAQSLSRGNRIPLQAGGGDHERVSASAV
jgi:glycosyltransferase involved in cell wall biosynthesis